MIGGGMLIHVIHLLIDGLIPLNAVFDKPKVKVLSNNDNFLESIGLASGSCGKKQWGNR